MGTTSWSPVLILTSVPQPSMLTSPHTPCHQYTKCKDFLQMLLSAGHAQTPPFLQRLISADKKQQIPLKGPGRGPGAFKVPLIKHTDKFSKHQSLLLASLLRLGYFPLNNIFPEQSPFLTQMSFLPHLPPARAVWHQTLPLAYPVLGVDLYDFPFMFLPYPVHTQEAQNNQDRNNRCVSHHEKKEPCKTSSQKMTDIYLCIFCVFLYTSS